MSSDKENSKFADKLKPITKNLKKYTHKYFFVIFFECHFCAHFSFSIGGCKMKRAGDVFYGSVQGSSWLIGWGREGEDKCLDGVSPTLNSFLIHVLDYVMGDKSENKKEFLYLLLYSLVTYK